MTFTFSDFLQPPELSTEDVEYLDSQRVYDGFFKLDRIQLRHQLFAGGQGPVLTRELLKRGPAVGAVLYDPKLDAIGLVEQYRIGNRNEQCGPWALEVVAGILDCGGTPEQAMRRELLEESGIEPQALRFICNYLSSPGGTDEKLYLYCAICDLSAGEGLFGLESEGEDIKLRIYRAQEVFNHLYEGRVNNAASLICLQWLQLHHRDLQNEYQGL